MRSFKLSRKAKKDLKNIAKFTAKTWGIEQRNLYLTQIDGVFSMLAENPKIGRDCPEILTGYRKFPYESHVIFYTEDAANEILIVRILHKNMDVSPIFGG